MADTTANDQAFIKISKELHCLRNDLAALSAVQYTNLRNTSLKGLRTDAVHSENYKGLGKIIELMSSEVKMREALEQLRERIHKLEDLSDVYMRGGDIVAARLAQE
jgi:hypothetical protein